MPPETHICCASTCSHTPRARCKNSAWPVARYKSRQPRVAVKYEWVCWPGVRSPGRPNSAISVAGFSRQRQKFGPASGAPQRHQAFGVSAVVHRETIPVQREVGQVELAQARGGGQGRRILGHFPIFQQADQPAASAPPGEAIEGLTKETIGRLSAEKAAHGFSQHRLGLTLVSGGQRHRANPAALLVGAPGLAEALAPRMRPRSDNR